MQEFESKQAKSEQADARRVYVAPALVTLGYAETENNGGIGPDGGPGGSSHS